jgi:hypothetical protein
MDLQTAVATEANHQIHTADLCTDHRLLLELLHRLENGAVAESSYELMRVVLELFRTQSAIEAQVLRQTASELEWDCQAIHELMETLESAAVEGSLHRVSVIELRLTLERYFSAKEALMGAPRRLQVPATRSTRALLRDRDDLRAYAQHMVRLH